jgi:hypothetical protein
MSIAYAPLSPYRIRLRPLRQKCPLEAGYRRPVAFRKTSVECRLRAEPALLAEQGFMTAGFRFTSAAGDESPAGTNCATLIQRRSDIKRR